MMSSFSEGPCSGLPLSAGRSNDFRAPPIDWSISIAVVSAALYWLNNEHGGCHHHHNSLQCPQTYLEETSRYKDDLIAMNRE